MSMVLARDTKPASSILRDTVRQSWPNTPQRPLAMTHMISSLVSGIPIPSANIPASSRKQFRMMNRTKMPMKMDTIEKMDITTADGVF